MGHIAAVVGASGYAGGELIRLIAAHPELELGTLTAAGNAGKRLGEVHPQLRSVADRQLVGLDDADFSADDVVFLALPHGASAAVANELPQETVVVDLGADFRIREPAAWSRWYGGDHAGAWPYGLPELPGAREQLAGQTRIANPGCYAAAVTLALAPLLDARLIEPHDIVAVAASGTSGAGRAPTAGLLGSEVMGDLSAYQVGGNHRHLAEIRQSLTEVAGDPVTVSFTPVLAPMPRGILATCTARLRAGVSEVAARDAMSRYESEPFVALLPEGQWPHTAATVGSNSCHLQVAVDDDVRRVVVVAAIDNLGKGAAGQAIQNANLALGLPEALGLPVDGTAP